MVNLITVPVLYKLFRKNYLLMVVKKDGFKVVVVDRGVVVREVDGVVEVVDVVPVVVRVVVVVGSAILGKLNGLRVDKGVCTVLDPLRKEEIEGFTARYAPSSSSL
jgi:hypothetical protein